MKPLSIRHFPDCVGRSKSVFSINSGKISDTTDWNAAPNQTKPPACFTDVDNQSCSSLLTSSAHINNNLNQKVKIRKKNQGIEVYHSGDYSYDEKCTGNPRFIHIVLLTWVAGSTINVEIPKPFQAAEKSVERQSPGSALDMSETSHLGPTQLAS